VTHRTFPALLDDQARRHGSRPLVTFYDDATGERVELSVLTYANWVAKTAGLLQDELDVVRGGTVAVDLPAHWLGPVWLGAVWSVGARMVAPGAPGGADLVVCGPEGVERYAGGGVPVVALSLLPMGARFATPLPAGVVDYGAVVWGQPDAFLADDPPGPNDAAWEELTHEELLAEAAAGDLAAAGTRLLTDVNPCTRAGLRTLIAPLMAGGGTVWVRHRDPDRWAHRARTEQAAAVLAEAGGAVA
jgi:uncharacterized protein (TIGR03089 family)